jgi:hypothetical protein
LRADPDLPVYRIRLHAADGRIRDELAGTERLTATTSPSSTAGWAGSTGASAYGPWTAAVLEVIAARPGVRATDLAASFGRETQPFKLDVRKLKNLGLTISLEVGYRLSPRGEAYLKRP